MDAEPGERERLRHAFAQRAGGAGMGVLKLAGEQAELVERTIVIIEPPRPPRPLLDRWPVTLVQMLEHISFFAPHASLDGRLAEDGANRLPERL